jgi:uncharacterized protein (DUF433 family)
MHKDYVSQIDGAYRINGTRVSLDSVVYAFLNGLTPENIVDSFPALTLEQVFGAITFYLANQNEIDEYLRQGDIEFEKLRNQLREGNADLYKKLIEYRNQKELISHT